MSHIYFVIEPFCQDRTPSMTSFTSAIPKKSRCWAFAAATVALAAALTSGLAACQSSSPSVEPETEPTAPSSEVTFDPEMTVTSSSESFEAEAEDGAPVTFHLTQPAVELTGTDPDVAQAFSEATVEHQTYLIDEARRATAVAPVVAWECDLAECEFPVEITEVNSGVFEEYGTILTTSQLAIGSTSRYPEAFAVTMNLRTGEAAELSDFIDPANPGVLNFIEELLTQTDQWHVCGDQIPDRMDSLAAFSPSKAGLHLYWAGSQSGLACSTGIVNILLPWDDATSESESDGESEADSVPSGESADPPAEPQETAPAAEPVAEDINGHWCPTEDSGSNYGCMTIALPIVTYDNTGQTAELTFVGDSAGTGGFSFIVPGAPFGTFMPAGIPLNLDGMYAVADRPDEDRIWNGQSGVLHVRQ